MHKRNKEDRLSRILDSYRRRKLRQSDVSTAHCLAVCRHMLQTTRYCFLNSQGDGGRISSRLVEPVADVESWTVWIGTNPTLRKVREVQRNPAVTLAFQSESEQANLILYGSVTVEKDGALRKKCWKDEWRLFFPNGSEGDDYVILEFTPQRLELLSLGRNVVLEPFGLRPVVLEREKGGWRAAGLQS